MLEHLFGSRTRVKLLRIFFADPRQRFFVRELTRMLDSQINAVRRELAHLTNAGIISAVTDDSATVTDDPHEGKRKYYQLNQNSVLFVELRALLMKSHVFGEQSLTEALAAAGDVSFLLFTGIFTNAHTQVDMLVVGEITEKKVAQIVSDFEHENGSQVRYTRLTTREFLERRQLMDRFLYAVLDAPHQVAIDNLANV